MAVKLPGGWVLSKPGTPGAGTDIVPARTAPAPSDEVIDAVIVDDPTEPTPKLEPDVEEKPKPKKEKPPRRHPLTRIFGIGMWGWVKLVVLCILVGFGVMIFSETQRATEENVANAAAIAAGHAWQAARWTAVNFWRPALYGAAVVIPIWVLWRVVTLPFRK